MMKSLSSKDLQEQSGGVAQFKSFINNFDVSTEYICIQAIPNLLELGADKIHQTDVESICEDFVKKINPYSFESVFQEISSVFSGVKFASKVLALKMICKYAELHPQVVS